MILICIRQAWAKFVAMNQSSQLEKWAVAGTAFAVSVLSFFVALLVGLPIFVRLAEMVGMGEGWEQLGVMGILFGTPVVGAICGIDLGAKLAGVNERKPVPVRVRRK
ncbi:MAG: hypothetical protein AAGC74_10335 [Verrucomicrobiota bacterium]